MRAGVNFDDSRKVGILQRPLSKHFELIETLFNVSEAHFGQGRLSVIVMRLIRA